MQCTLVTFINANYIDYFAYSLDRVLNPVLELLSSDYNKPKYVHTIENARHICSMVSTENFLIIGTVNEIIGWDWKMVINAKLGKPKWSIKIPSQPSTLEQSDVNSLWLTEDEVKLYAGCGDNNIYCFHLEDGRLISTLKGHRDYVHSVFGK